MPRRVLVHRLSPWIFLGAIVCCGAWPPAVADGAFRSLFRGLRAVQRDAAGVNNRVSSLGRNGLRGQPWYADLSDDFQTMGGGLDDRSVDGWQVGFVPPIDLGSPTPGGPLEILDPTGGLSELHGRWMADPWYLVENGRIRLNPTSGSGLPVWQGETANAVLPWHVSQDLDGDYLLQSDMRLAAGETAALAFTSHPEGGRSLSDDEFGQLSLAVTRLDDMTVAWTVKWDSDGDQQAQGNRFVSVAALVDQQPDQLFTLQLAWDSIREVFDAWLDDRRLVQGSLVGQPISVRGVGLQIQGTESYLENFVAAVHGNRSSPTAMSFGDGRMSLMVPETATGSLWVLSLLLLLRRGRCRSAARD